MIKASSNVLLALAVGLASLTVASAAVAEDVGKNGYERERTATWLDDVIRGRSRMGTRSTEHVSISASGRWVAFMTDAPMAPGDLNLMTDIYLQDIKSGKVELASRTPSGVPAAGPTSRPPFLSMQPTVSDDGRYVAFTSEATNLVIGDTNAAVDVFVYDRKSKTVDRVSLNNKGEEAISLPVPLYLDSLPSISANGRYVSFTSSAINLVPDDSNLSPDVFVRDRKLNATMRVSVASDGSQPDRTCYDASSVGGSAQNCLLAGNHGRSAISGSGRFVAFQSRSEKLVEGDTNQGTDVFLHDLKTKETTRVSVASDGSQAQIPAGSIGLDRLGEIGSSDAVSHDGRFVTFASVAGNLVPNHGNQQGVPNAHGNGKDIYIHDRNTGRTRRISVESDGREVKAKVVGLGIFFQWPALSADGRFVVSDAPCANSIEGETYFDCWSGGAYVFDVITGEVDALHVNDEIPHPEARFSGGWVDTSSISRGGRFVAVSTHFDSDEGPECRPAICSAAVFVDRGATVGAVSGGQAPPSPDEPQDDRICVTPDLCLPSRDVASSSDSTDDVSETLTAGGANLYEIALVHRPRYQDLFAAIELEHMPQVFPGVSPIFHGMRFEAQNETYEVRATSALGGTFGLFNCSDRSICEKVADLKGGYGTTGMRVVFSIPLQEIGLEDGGQLNNVEAFSAFGSSFSGATKVLDTVRLR